MSLVVDIRKRLGSFSLNVAFEADREVLAILGSSGCGKSMTLKCIAGIERPDEGFISLDGRVLFDSEKKINLTPQKRRVGYLFQQYALFPNMTVRENIAAGVRREKAPRRDDIVAAQIRSMHLEGLEKNKPGQLSGGQQQRAALARIFANEPELLLLDEPFSALDSFLKWQLEMELSDTLKRFSGTSVFVSHDRDEVYHLCDSVCVLTEGKSEPKTAVRALFHAPKTLAACLITGCKNYSRIERLDETHVKAPDWGAELLVPGVPESTAYAGVRAHDIRPGGGENELRCTVERRVEDLFSDIVMLKTPGGGMLRMEAPGGELSGLLPGTEISVSVAPENIMLLEG